MTDEHIPLPELNMISDGDGTDASVSNKGN
jgi:hypothetical protein